MNTLKIIVFFIFFSHINTLFSQKNNIIPTPIEQTINSGYMEIENSPEIIADFELNSAATLFKDAVKKLELANDKQTKNRIIFSLNKKLKYEEYILKINSDKITIEASTETGAIYGFQSLNQLMNLNLNRGVAANRQWFIFSVFCLIMI